MALEVPRGYGYHHLWLEHLGGTEWSQGTRNPVSLTWLGLEEAVAHVIAGDRDALATLLLVDVKLPGQRVDHHGQVPLPHLPRGTGSGPGLPPLPQGTAGPLGQPARCHRACHSPG